MTTWLFDPATEGAEPGDVLEITMRFDGDTTVCLLSGPLCAYTAPILDDWLAELQRNGRRRVIVDATALDALSGDGVDVLVDHAGRCRAAGGGLQVRAGSAVARRVLALCDADHLLEDRPRSGGGG